jgi:KGK domain
MTQEPIRLQNDDVVWIANETGLFVINYKTFLSGDFLNSLNQQCQRIVHPSNVEIRDKWFMSGIDCEVLQPSKNWQKGKVRICLEFIPEVEEEEEQLSSEEIEEAEEVEAESSPLDEIRKLAKESD